MQSITILYDYDDGLLYFELYAVCNLCSPMFKVKLKHSLFCEALCFGCGLVWR
jgi:hypothetical protein